ncbi:PilZ domain-containing protein [Vibrio sp.]|uniref:PilZ domain-containing protein n=1 Tax=Vibrio sp. TaxID=678 RepID=UPI003D1435E2
MQQSEILSLAERLIPAYNSDDFEKLLNRLTGDEPPSVKILVKIELNRVMAPCTKTIDLRGRVQGECREYQLDGRIHWLDDVAFNAYHKNVRKYGSYTEGVWEALYNTRNNYRVMKQNGQIHNQTITSSDSPFEVEPITLGYDLKRAENRLKLASQVEVTLPSEQLVHAISVDLSPSGARLKVPTAFDYKLGEILTVRYVELSRNSDIHGVDKPVQYRLVGIDDSYDNDAVKYLRLLRLTQTNVIERVIEESLHSNSQKVRHDNQDKIIRARSRGYEHTYLKHTCSLPVFFSGNQLKLVLMTENNQPVWQYWHDERNQQSLSALFNPERMAQLTKPGMRGSNNVIYSFNHQHQDKTLFFSMMMPEASREVRQLFWHIGSKKTSWRAFRLSVFELSDQEKQTLSQHSSDLNLSTDSLTHFGMLQEIADDQSGADYRLTEKPRLAGSELNRFCHPRQSSSHPSCLYFDAKSRRREPRYRFRSPIEVTIGDRTVAGFTQDLSKHGLSITLDTPIAAKADDQSSVNFKELQLYNEKLPLNEVPYQVIRVSNGGRTLQLVIESTSQTNPTIAFLNKLISHNQDKLMAQKELLPSNQLLEDLHNILLDKMVSSPIFVTKTGPNLAPHTIGVNYPLLPHLAMFAKLGHEQRISLEPIFKGRTNTLLATPMKRISGAEPQYHEIYISTVKFGTRIQSMDTMLTQDFTSTRERIEFVKKAQLMGDFFALRVCGVPVFDPLTELLKTDLDELTQLSVHQARSLEKEIQAIVGYGEIVDITDEVLIRLELTQ